MSWALPAVALIVLAVAAVSERLRGTPVTAQMLFLAAGVLVGGSLFDVVGGHSVYESTKTFAEATLALVLFNDASRVNLHELRSELGLPARLLGIGLPLTIAFGALVASVLFGFLKPAEAAVLGVLLAPTDAALGQAVVEDERVPVSIRQGLNVESGLNDGICVPVLFVFLAAADAEVHALSAHEAVTLAAEEIGFGILAGIAAGVLTALVMRYAQRHKLIAESWRQAVPVAGAALAYGAAAALGGSGFIAAFAAGATFGRGMRGRSESSERFSEEFGALLGGVTFILLGAVLLGPQLHAVTWQMLVYAVLSLTVVRMVPVALALIGTHSTFTEHRVRGLVWTAWSGLDRLRADRRRRVAHPRGPHDRPDRLRHDRALDFCPRPHRRAARRPLRPVARGPPRGA